MVVIKFYTGENDGRRHWKSTSSVSSCCWMMPLHTGLLIGNRPYWLYTLLSYSLRLGLTCPTQLSRGSYWLLFSRGFVGRHSQQESIQRRSTHDPLGMSFGKKQPGKYLIKKRYRLSSLWRLRLILVGSYTSRNDVIGTTPTFDAIIFRVEKKKKKPSLTQLPWWLHLRAYSHHRSSSFRLMHADELQ